VCVCVCVYLGVGVCVYVCVCVCVCVCVLRERALNILIVLRPWATIQVKGMKGSGNK